MRPLRPCLLAAALLPCLALPLRADPRWPAVVDAHVEAVRQQLRTVDMEGFRAIQAAPGDALLLDVREADEVARGRIPGTTHLPRGLLEFGIWRLLGHPAPVDTGRVIYVHCANGNRATLAAKQLQDVGFTRVTAVVMALDAWQRAGLPMAQ